MINREKSVETVVKRSSNCTFICRTSTSSQSKRRKMDEKNTIINDPVWGPIKPDPLCMKIIDTPQFQRLRHIKQLGGCSFVYPGACHSRFEHSIGTAHLARMMGEELQKKHTKGTISDQDILCLEVAGLCHDLGHGPFSHLFDQQFKSKVQEREKKEGTTCRNWTHEKLSIEMLDKVFETLDGSVDLNEFIGIKGKELIKELIEPSKAKRKERPFLYEIISNEENKIDVDKWDYFSRDCHMLGLHHNFQCQRSIKLARIVDNHISFPKSEYFNLFDMFYTRFTLHRRAYQHNVVKAVEMMIADAFLKADNYLTFPPVRNPGVVAGKENKKVQKRLSESMGCMDTYQWVTDDVLQQIRRLELEADENSVQHRDVGAAQNIIDRIYCRDLYKLIREKRVKWDTESIKALNIADKLTAFANSLKQSEMKIAGIKNDITEILETDPIPEAKSEIENIAKKLTTHVDSLKQSATEVDSLKNDMTEIQKNDLVPEANSELENIDEKLKTLVESLKESATKVDSLEKNITKILKTEASSGVQVGSLKNDIAKILKTDQVTSLRNFFKQSTKETPSLSGFVDVILNTYQVSELKSLIQDGGLQNYIAEKLNIPQVPEEYYYIEVVVFNYGSGRKNPMEKVKFHKKKDQPDQSQPSTIHGSTDQYESVSSKDMDEKKSDMIPTTFEQIYVRLYWKDLKENKEHQNLKEVLKNAFLDISEFECNMGSMYKGELVNI